MLKAAATNARGQGLGPTATLVSGRTNYQCYKRWSHVLDPSTLTAGRTGKWGEDEDSMLKAAVQMHGDKDWVLIATLVSGRTKH
jgi:hypothetical protein